MLSAAKKSALLVDFDNLYIERWEQRLVDALPNWLAWLEDGQFDPLKTRRRFLIQRVYWNIGFDTQFRIPFQRRKFENVVCRAVRNKDRASSADFVITVDAVELRHEQRALDEVIILTFDSDFLTVLGHLQSKDIAVAAMAAGNDRPAQAYRQLADFVIEAEAFEAAFQYQRPKRGFLGRVRAEAAAPAKAAAEAKPARAAPAKAAPPRTAPAKPAAQSAPAPAEPAKAPATRARRAVSAPSAPAQPARGKAAPTFDFKHAARLVEGAAPQSPTPYLAKKLVNQVLEAIEGFRAQGAAAYLGCGDYPTMIDAIARESALLEVRDGRNGGKVLFFLGGEDPAPARA